MLRLSPPAFKYPLKLGAALSIKPVTNCSILYALADSQLCSTVPDDMDVDQLFDTYSTVLNSIADQLAQLMPFATVRDGQQRGSTLSAVQCAASVAVWNVVTDEKTILLTVDFGWNLRDVALDCIGRRRSSTGLID